MGEYLIIDGYNVINAWKDFAQLRQENLEHARELWQNMLPLRAIVLS